MPILFAYHLANSTRAIVNPAKYALTIPTGNMIAYAHPTTPLAMARYGAIFFVNLNIISIYLNYTKDAPIIGASFRLFPLSPNWIRSGFATGRQGNTPLESTQSYQGTAHQEVSSLGRSSSHNSRQAPPRNPQTHLRGFPVHLLERQRISPLLHHCHRTR